MPGWARMYAVVASLACLCACAAPAAAPSAAPAPHDVATAVDTVDAVTPPPDIPVSTANAWLATELLGRPTASGATLNIVPATDLEAYVEFGTVAGVYSGQTAPQAQPTGEPMVFEIEGLVPDTRYSYRVRFRAPGQSDFLARAERSFHTARPPGSTFVFTIQADSHMDDKSSAEIYERTLALAAAAQPDFHIDLGDTFMCEKHSQAMVAEIKPAADLQTVVARYLQERHYFGLLAHSSPLFLVNGNHEGEAGWLNDGTPNNLAVWTTLSRKRYYPNPEPNQMYTAPSGAEPTVGLRQHPYAWQWGDALFVVLDPFWYTKTVSKQQNRWNWTLGKPQYDWLRATLEGSQAKFKFVFAHHIVGGNDAQSRGGIEAAPYFEWGGQELDGSDTFAKNRPGWGKPIHQLFVDTHVSAFFHGHDHVYVRQELDGVVYQELPQPSATNTTNGAQLAKEAGYVAGTILSSAGHLRVTVTPSKATIAYVRTWLPKDENATHVNGSIDDSIEINAK